MILVIALIVCVTAVSLLFMQELLGIFKKVVSIPGVALLGPLLLASWIIEAYADWLEWLRWVCHNESRNMLERVVATLPFQTVALHVLKIMFLCLFAFIPVFVIWAIERYKGRYKLPRIASYISIVTWIIAVFLLN